MTEELLNGADVVAGFEEMRRKRVPAPHYWDGQNLDKKANFRISLFREGRTLPNQLSRDKEANRSIPGLTLDRYRSTVGQ